MTIHKSERTLAINQAITRAHRRADETGLEYAVVELDYDDRRVIRVVLLSSTCDEDFDDACGEILYSTDTTLGQSRGRP